MKFELLESERKKANEWIASLKPEILAIQKQSMSNADFIRLTCDGKYPYYGTAGGGVTYSFAPNGIGCIIKVKEWITGKEIDITDYSMF